MTALMNLKSLKERQCIKLVPFVGKGEERENLENLGINELHKKWCYDYITNEVRFVLLAAVIIKPFNTSLGTMHGASHPADLGTLHVHNRT
jgi:hypothetical protein